MSSNKPRLVEVTDPDEIKALRSDYSDLGVPYSYAPNGHLWVDAGELAAWRLQHTSGATHE